MAAFSPGQLTQETSTFRPGIQSFQLLHYIFLNVVAPGVNVVVVVVVDSLLLLVATGCYCCR